MNITERTITVKEFYDAIIMDGYNHLRADWIQFKKVGNKLLPTGGCLLGMAAVNLGVSPDNEWLHDIAIGELGNAIAYQESEWDDETESWIEPNDVEITGLREALNRLPVPNSFVIPEGVYHRGGVGDLLVTLNDTFVQGSIDKFRFSYDELAQFAKEILEPYFDTRLTVTEVDFTSADNIQYYETA